jgi:hypothetical protein
MNSDYNQDWIKRCLLRLAEKHCFISTLHKARYERVLNMIYEQPFFGIDMAKFAFLSTACGQENDNRFEALLTHMVDNGAKDSSGVLMKLKAINDKLHGTDRILNTLAIQFFLNPYETPDESCLLRVSRAYVRVGECTLAASDVLNTM